MNSVPQIIQTISYLALPLILAIVLHEYAHGWVADHFGDSTARTQGRPPRVWLRPPGREPRSAPPRPPPLRLPGQPQAPRGPW